MTEIELRHCRDRDAAAIADELVDVYADVYGGPPYAGDPFFAVDRFAQRLRGALAMNGFEVVTARVDGRLAGYVHGVTLDPAQPWWDSLAAARPAAAVRAAEREDVFWLRELMVRPDAAGHGVGRRLHAAVVAGRNEGWTTLTCIVDNEPAHSAYGRWGYRILGPIRHAPESPVYDAMLLLPPAGNGSSS
ncbi:GNAT family N-acetyltransferase [Embleya sp. NBC_00896]|uniref:GNAT family N-acetyltransferase n=1 Tax=Embleya sp. NBC_00896 TaxID=2975961 RepID=UPI002F913642|nr:GNAT family N-acetyltransferase [Embleya sp. NBC_00896]